MTDDEIMAQWDDAAPADHDDRTPVPRGEAPGDEARTSAMQVVIGRSEGSQQLAIAGETDDEWLLVDAQVAMEARQ